jgi:hypothetical protein
MNTVAGNASAAAAQFAGGSFVSDRSAVASKEAEAPEDRAGWRRSPDASSIADQNVPDLRQTAPRAVDLERRSMARRTLTRAQRHRPPPREPAVLSR